MDCNLTYDEHVTQVTSKCLGTIVKSIMLNMFDQHTLFTIIRSLVSSKLCLKPDIGSAQLHQ